MTPAAPTPNERERLAALERYEMLDTPAEAEFDDLTSLAAQICGTPIALISLVDARRQWFKSKIGLDADETSREISFCGHAIQGQHLMEVPNACEEFLFHDNPLVTGPPEIRFYAGMPLATPDGQNLGTLCVMDRVPRYLSVAQRKALGLLGRQVMNQMELRLTNRRLAAAGQEMREVEERFRLVVEAAANAMVLLNEQGQIMLVNAAAESLFGYSRAELIGQPVEMLLPKLEPHSMQKARNLTGKRKDGTELSTDVTLNPLPTSAGGLVLASIIDATGKQKGEQINRLKQDLKRKKRQLTRAKRELRDFTSIVSRDLGAPLRGLTALANWIVTRYANRLDGSGREQLNLLALKVRRLNTLLEGILNSPPSHPSREDRVTIPFKITDNPTPESTPSPGNGFARSFVNRSPLRLEAGLGYPPRQAQSSANDLENGTRDSEIALVI